MRANEIIRSPQDSARLRAESDAPKPNGEYDDASRSVEDVLSEADRARFDDTLEDEDAPEDDK
jgi:hypothetical protein